MSAEDEDKEGFQIGPNMRVLLFEKEAFELANASQKMNALARVVVRL